MPSAAATPDGAGSGAGSLAFALLVLLGVVRVRWQLPCVGACDGDAVHHVHYDGAHPFSPRANHFSASWWRDDDDNDDDNNNQHEHRAPLADECGDDLDGEDLAVLFRLEDEDDGEDGEEGDEDWAAGDSGGEEDSARGARGRRKRRRRLGGRAATMSTTTASVRATVMTVTTARARPSPRRAHARNGQGVCARTWRTLCCYRFSRREEGAFVAVFLCVCDGWMYVERPRCELSVPLRFGMIRT
jgi:hypothetical protein